ncbi:unnamed protein product [Rangifer tarandus platyrhynchus]|uniref:Uncharacterized protein n=1 Tax=Rangifer tarandus platyrhynchus TaxID=3082113 RepID=A0ABN8ZF69_RANTA|nr:unnamed protein product [Rangifer tarandus platyrhynchus]
MSGSSWPRAAASCCQLELGPASEATSVRQATAGELLFPGGRKEVSAPRRLRAPRQPLFSPRALASRGPGRQRFVPAGHPHLLGLPLLGSGSLAPCPTSSPLGAQDEAPGMA